MKLKETINNRKKQKKIRMAVLVLALLLFGSIGNTKTHTVYAASASVGFEEMATEAVTGQEMTIYLVIRTDESLGDFESDISYDPAYLEFVSGPACVSGGDGTLTLSDIGASESAEVRRYALTFRTLQSGVTRLAATGTLLAYEYETGNEMSVSSSTYMLSIADEKSMSDDASLAILKINPGSLSPSFEAGILEYNTSVDSNTNQLSISALPNDQDATVTVIGQDALKDGMNEVYIEVTAKSGATRVYTIYVTKESDSNGMLNLDGTSDIQNNKEDLNDQNLNDEGTEENQISDRMDITGENGIQAYKEDADTLILGQYQYRIVSDAGLVRIPDGYEESVLLLNGIMIPSYVKEGEEDLGTMLLVLENEAGEVNLYRYDRMEKTIQRVSDDILTVTLDEEVEELRVQLAKLTKKYQDNIERLGLIVAGLTMGLAGIAISLIVRVRKKKRDQEWE